MNHFDEMTALLLLEGQLDAAHVQEVKAHAASCAQCRELLRALEMEGVWLRQAIAVARNPDIQRWQQKYADKQRTNQPSHNDDGKGPLRIRTYAARQRRG